MIRTGRQTGVAGNPLLVGTATVLATVVAIFLAYNANDGLPFVAKYRVDAIVRDADLLGHNAEVRIGGRQVGIVSGAEVVRGEGGRPLARLRLALDQPAGPLPADTRVRVRPKSVIGLRYLQLTPGRSPRTIPDGGTIPLQNHRGNVGLQDALNAFDARTRRATAAATVELGDALAGRGRDLNAAIRAFPPLLGHLAPVMRNLAAPETDLRGLLRGVDGISGALAPVARVLPGLFDGAATTLHAIARVDRDFGRLIDETPVTQRVAVTSLRRVRPVLADAAGLVEELHPGVGALPSAATRLAAALEAGTPVLRRTAGLTGRLRATLSAVGVLVRDPATAGSVVELTRLLDALIPALRYVNPAQTRCNLFGLYGKNAGPTIGEGDENGNWFRFLPLQNAPDNPYQGEPAPNLHMDPYVDSGQNGRCVAGNERFEPGQRIGPPPNAATAPTANPLTRPPADAREAAP